MPKMVFLQDPTRVSDYDIQELPENDRDPESFVRWSIIVDGNNLEVSCSEKKRK